MKTRSIGVVALSAAALLLIGCNQNVPASPPAGDTTTIVPVPVPTPAPDIVPVPVPGPEGPPGPPGPEGPPAPTP